MKTVQKNASDHGRTRINLLSCRGPQISPRPPHDVNSDLLHSHILSSSRSRGGAAVGLRGRAGAGFGEIVGHLGIELLSGFWLWAAAGTATAGTTSGVALAVGLGRGDWLGLGFRLAVGVVRNLQIAALCCVGLYLRDTLAQGLHSRRRRGTRGIDYHFDLGGLSKRPSRKPSSELHTLIGRLSISRPFSSFAALPAVSGRTNVMAATPRLVPF